MVSLSLTRADKDRFSMEMSQKCVLCFKFIFEAKYEAGVIFISLSAVPNQRHVKRISLTVRTSYIFWSVFQKTSSFSYTVHQIS